MPRPMTPARAATLQGYFSNLDVNQAVVTGNASWVYNCIAWTVGFQTAGFGQEIRWQAFDIFYFGIRFCKS